MRWLVLVASAVILFLAYYPTFHHWQSTPDDRVWTGTTFYSDDYAVYVHTIHQGMRGRWTVVDKFTSEPHAGSFLHIYYLLAGKFFSLFGLNAITTYHLLRILASITFLFAAWNFVKTILSNNFLKAISWTIICFANSLPAKYFLPQIDSWLPWVDEPEVTVRFATQSHHTFGSALMLLQLTLFLKFLQKPKLRLLVTSTLFAFIHSWTEPNTAFATLITLGIYVLLKQISSSKITLSLKSVVERLSLHHLSLIFAASLPALLYFRFLDRTEPWKTLFIFDKFQHFNLSLPRFLSSLGLPFVLSLVIFLPIILKWKKLPSLVSRDALILTISLVAEFLAIYLIAPHLNINRLRFFHQPVFVPLAILGSITLFYFTSQISKIPKSLTLILTLTYILLTTPATVASYNRRIHEYDDLSTLVYPTRWEFESFNWLRDNTMPSDVVLALYEVSNLIPIFSGNTVYAGNVSETLNYDAKSRLATRFYQNQMSTSEAQSFLRDGHIKYVFIGFQETQGLDPAKLPHLTRVYQNYEALIYKYQPD